MTYPVSTAFMVVAGYMCALSYAMSRKRIYLCNECRSRFAHRPLFSWLLLPIYWLHILYISLFIIGGVIFIAFMLVSEWLGIAG